MDLFGAATTGVDPQSGSYLNKQQRVAMFRASRGMGGGGGGAEKEQKKNAVAPQSAIVVANKMTAVVQQLQQNNQESVQAVNVKVEQNRRDIANIYKAVEINRDKEAEQEKLETRDLRREREGFLRGARENLVEGLSSAVAGLANFGRQAASAALSPVKGLWEKIRDFLTNIALAWAAFNADSIIEKIGEFINWVKGFKLEFKFSLDQIGGIFSIIDLALRRVGRIISRIARTVWNVAKFIGTKIYQLLKRIFTPIGRFLGNIFKGIVSNLKKIVSGGLRNIKNALQNGWNSLKGAPNGAKEGVNAARGAQQGARQASRAWWDPRRVTDFIGDKAQQISKGAKNFFKQGATAISNIGGNLKKNILGNINIPKFGGAASADEAQKVSTSKVTDYIKGIFGKAGRGGAGLGAGLSRAVGGLLKRVPVVSTAINFVLNDQKGVGFWENLARSLSESLLGMVGAAAGAKVGAGIGAAIGTGVFPFVGTAVGGVIGGALGGIIGSIMLGQLGDYGGAKIYETLSGEKSTDTGNVIKNLVEGASMEPDAALKDPKDDHSTDANFNVSALTEGESTPEGMQVPTDDSPPSIETMDAAPIDIREEKKEEEKQRPYERAGTTPFWKTSDSMADVYRTFAITAYQMAG